MEFSRDTDLALRYVKPVILHGSILLIKSLYAVPVKGEADTRPNNAIYPDKVEDIFLPLVENQGPVKLPDADLQIWNHTIHFYMMW